MPTRKKAELPRSLITVTQYVVNFQRPLTLVYCKQQEAGQGLGLNLSLCFSLLSGYSTTSTKTGVRRKDSSIKRKAPDTNYNSRCSQQQVGVEEEAVSFVDALYSPAAGHDEQRVSRNR